MNHKRLRRIWNLSALTAMAFLAVALVFGCSGSSGGGGDDEYTLPQLAAPKITFCEAWDNEISLAWDMVSGAEQYMIYRETSANGAFDKAVATVNAPNLTWTDPDQLEYDVSYYYKMRASAAGRETSPLSNLVSDTTRRRATLSTPTFYSWSSTDTTVTLTWWEDLDASDRYLVYRDTSSSGTFEELVATVYRPTVTFTDTGLSPGTTYWYKIMSKSAAGEISDLSEAYSATTTGTGGGTGTLHLWSEVSTAMTAYANGLLASLTSDSTQPVYYESSPDASIITFHFNDYVSNGYTLNGSVTSEDLTYNGTINYTGGDVASITYNNYTPTAMTGTLEVTFTDGSLWEYDLSTLSWTEQ